MLKQFDGHLAAFGSELWVTMSSEPFVPGYAPPLSKLAVYCTIPPYTCLFSTLLFQFLTTTVVSVDVVSIAIRYGSL